MRDELQAVLALAETTPWHSLPELLGDLERIRATVFARLVAGNSAPPADTEEQLLSVDEAAQLLGLSQSYLYRNHRRLSYARHVGDRVLFSRNAIQAHLKRAR